MNNLRQAAQAALDALTLLGPSGVERRRAAEMLRAALAEPQPEPTARNWFVQRTQRGFVISSVAGHLAGMLGDNQEANAHHICNCVNANADFMTKPQPEPSNQNDWMWEDCSAALESMTCPWCERQGIDICQHADDAKNCEKTK